MELSQHCSNCSFELRPTDRFCGQCGQRKAIHRFTLGHLAHEVSHAVTHADATIITLIRDILIRPAQVLHHYIVLGKRKSYFNPFTAVLLLGGLLLIVTNIFKPYRIPKLEPQLEAARATLEKDPAKAAALKMFDRSQTAARFIEKNNKLLMLLSIPLTAWVFWLGYRRTGLNYAEHVVAATFLTCGLCVFFSVFMIPVMGLVKQTNLYNWVMPASLLFQLAYFALAYNRWGQLLAVRYSAWRGWWLSLLNIALWSIVSAGGILVYVFLGLVF